MLIQARVEAECPAQILQGTPCALHIKKTY